MLDGVSTNTQGNSFPPHGNLCEMNRALVIGNGQSRKWYCPSHQTIMKPVQTWGCNAIYRDREVDHLVAVDNSMQQEIYDSDYDGKCHFAHWSPVPSAVADMMFMGYDIPDAFIHHSKTRGEECVIQGKDPVTLQEKIEVAIQMNPNLDIPDLVQKMEKDVGVWITYLKEEDNVAPIDYPVGWSTGNTAMHLACQEGVDEVFLGKLLRHLGQGVTPLKTVGHDYVIAPVGIIPEGRYEIGSFHVLREGDLCSHPLLNNHKSCMGTCVEPLIADGTRKAHGNL